MINGNRDSLSTTVSHPGLNVAGSLKGKGTSKTDLSVQDLKLTKETEKMVNDGNGCLDCHRFHAVINRKVETYKAEDIDAEEIEMDDLTVKEGSITVDQKTKSCKEKESYLMRKVESEYSFMEMFLGLPLLFSLAGLGFYLSLIVNYKCMKGLMTGF